MKTDIIVIGAVFIGIAASLGFSVDSCARNQAQVAIECIKAGGSTTKRGETYDCDMTGKKNTP